MYHNDHKYRKYSNQVMAKIKKSFGNQCTGVSNTPNGWIAHLECPDGAFSSVFIKREKVAYLKPVSDEYLYANS